MFETTNQFGIVPIAHCSFHLFVHTMFFHISWGLVKRTFSKAFWQGLARDPVQRPVGPSSVGSCSPKFGQRLKHLTSYTPSGDKNQEFFSGWFCEHPSQTVINLNYIHGKNLLKKKQMETYHSAMLTHLWVENRDIRRRPGGPAPISVAVVSMPQQT